MKKKFAALFLVLALAGLYRPAQAASNSFTDFLTILGRGTLWNTAVFWIDTARSVYIYDGDMYLGGKAATPSATAGEYPGFKVPIKNNGATAWVQGTAIMVDSVCVGCGKTATATTDLTSIVGFSEGAVAAGANGYMTIGGYALILTTGTVNRGDTLVSTASAAGYLTGDTTPTTGTDMAVALASGTAAGGLTLSLVRY